MKVIPRGSKRAEKVTSEGAQEVRLSELISVGEGAKNFELRLFELEPGGHTPLHEHPWEHEVFIVSGAGELRGGKPLPFKEGDAVFVEPGETHQFANTGSEKLRFICCIPMMER
jgi:quercetin dioxygenase-like cupin family protein